MSATSRFEEEFSSYSNQLDNYKDRVNQLKELASMKPADAIVKVSGEITLPIGAHLLTKGLGKVIAKGKSFLKEKTDQLSDLKSKVSDQLDRVTDVQDRISGVGEDPSLFPQGAGGRVDLSSDFVENGVIRKGTGRETTELSETDDYEFSQTFENPVFDPQSVEGLSNFREPPPGNSSTNVVGRLLRRQADEQQQPEGETDIDDSVSKLDDTQSTAKAGEDTVVDSTEDIADVGEGIGEEAAVDTAAAATESAGAEIAATTGAETAGIGFLVGGAVALAGALAGIFAGHKHHPNIPKPNNLSQPVFTSGLAEN